MKLTNFTDMLDHAQKHHYGLGAFCCCNAETALAAIEAGSKLRSPVLFIASHEETPILTPKGLVEVVKCVAEGCGVPVGLHLDHAPTVDFVRECMDAGFPSVMYDGSSLPFEENIKNTRLVVEEAHSRGIGVEGEIGAIGRCDKSTVEGGKTTLTDVDEAVEFVERTGVDALAVSIGNSHGMYTSLPQLDFELLQEIRNRVNVHLVLHGGSGTPPDQLNEAVRIGITKINVASEIGKAYINGIVDFHNARSGNFWWTHGVLEAKLAARAVVERWMIQLESAGKTDV